MKSLDRVLLITGAASGIGLAMAHLAADRGYRLALLDRDVTLLDSAIASVSDRAEVMGVAADVTDYPLVEKAVARVVERFGRLDACFNNAGIGAPLVSVPDADPGDFERVMRVNTFGSFHVLKAVLHHMRSRGGGGAIVNTGSILAERGAPDYAIYCASKHAVHGLTRAVALEASAYNVRVNAVAPGLVDTPMNDAFHSAVSPAEPEATRRAIESKIPLQKYADPAQIARAALFLLSEEAGYITGEILDVDGGLSTGF